MSPFFDPSTLNDEELREKLSNLQTRLFAAHAMGMSYDMRAQLESMMEQIEFEQQARFAAQMQKAWDAQFPDVIETEPDLKPGAEAAKKAANPKDKKKKEGVPERPANAPTFNKVYKK
ncbi:hypothetical protein D3C87_737030 [compost metagenome]